MRRKDREITDPKRIDEIIKACDCCRLGLADGDEAYIVPLSFGYLNTCEKRVFYFHSAKEGRKIEMIKKQGRAGFELDTNHALNTEETACEYSYRFQSVIGSGIASITTDEAEKTQAMRLIMEHYTGRVNWKFDEKTLNMAAIIKLEVISLSCKEHL